MGEKLRYDPDKRGAGKGWAFIGAFVLGFDLLNKETLTNGFARAREHENPVIRRATVAALGVTALHLMDLIPEKYDPIDRINIDIQRLMGKARPPEA